jgi:hypothetical protein
VKAHSPKYSVGSGLVGVVLAAPLWFAEFSLPVNVLVTVYSAAFGVTAGLVLDTWRSLAFESSFGARVRAVPRADDVVQHLETILDAVGACGERPFMDEVARHDLAVTAERFRRTAGGECVLDRRAGRIADLSSEASTSIWGVTDYSDEKWWKSPEGKRFHDWNCRRAREGLDIRRVFLANGDELDEVERQQRDAGVHTALYRRGEWPESLVSSGRPLNFTIFDGVFVHWDEYGADGRTTGHGFSDGKSTVGDFVGRFERGLG